MTSTPHDGAKPQCVAEYVNEKLIERTALAGYTYTAPGTHACLCIVQICEMKSREAAQ